MIWTIKIITRGLIALIIAMQWGLYIMMMSAARLYLAFLNCMINLPHSLILFDLTLNSGLKADPI